ncbi:MAG: hypothetical protein K8S94_14845 [Planctomycetia bacterium]|nr:hypothetical protein [Planctomycetia bacterium]
MQLSATTTRATTWGCLAVFCLVASGLPLPLGGSKAGIGGGRTNPAAAARLAGKDRSTPFPCMDKACGCATAEQCLQDCCCNTPAETLAWARAHDVAPAILASLMQRAAASLPKASGSCCSAATPSCCEAAEPSCCAVDQGDEPPARIPDAAHVVGVRSIVLRAMLACGGVADEWSSGGLSLPPPLVTSVSRPSPTATITIADDPIKALPRSPDAPPPRAC